MCRVTLPLALASSMTARKPIRLISLLVISHTVLALILAVALGILLAALGTIYGLMGEVREQQLGTISEEEQLHRDAWALEVAARHGIDACEQGAPDQQVADSLAVPLRQLRESMRRFGPRAEPRLRALMERYEHFAAQAIAGNTCARLRSAEARRQRLLLDEELTTVWIDRLYVLHHAIDQKEEQARRIGARAITAGASLVLLALLTMVALTRWIALGVTAPLAGLARAARRVGRGDFSPIPQVRGPIEVVELSLELDRMRAHLAEIDSLKQGFLASVSHELRTPLTKLREALSLLSDGTAGPLTERQRNIVAIAQGACEREIHIVSTLLDLSRLRAGGPLKLEPGQSLDDAIEVAISEERAEAERRRVSIEVTMPGTAPLAMLDGPLVERAIANLVRNAVSVSPPGERVTVTRDVLNHGPQGEPGTWACVRVRDHGPGVPDEIRDHLFEPFVTHRLSARPGQIGIGLGLTLAREVARAHGGDVRLANEQHPGATFEIWLPLRTSTMPVSPSPGSHPPAGKEQHHGQSPSH